MGALIFFFDFGPTTTTAVVDRWADVLMLDLDPIGQISMDLDQQGRIACQAEVIA